MNRLRAALKQDVIIQYHNKLYAVGVVVSLFLMVVLAFLAEPEQLPVAVPALILLAIGGTTMFYVAGMLLFERDEGTLHAVVVSPLRTREYLWSKLITLTVLATLETIIMVVGAMFILGRSAVLDWPNVPIFLFGTITLGMIYTLVGLILVVRYDKITAFLFPAAGLVGLLQMPFLYFLDLVKHPIFLIIPPSAPTLIIRGAYLPLTPWEWTYALGYTTVTLTVLILWANRAFHRHVRMNLA